MAYFHRSFSGAAKLKQFLHKPKPKRTGPEDGSTAQLDLGVRTLQCRLHGFWCLPVFLATDHKIKSTEKMHTLDASRTVLISW